MFKHSIQQCVIQSTFICIFLAGMRIRIRSDPVIFGPPEPDPDFFLQLSRIRIRIRGKKIPDPHPCIKHDIFNYFHCHIHAVLSLWTKPFLSFPSYSCFCLISRKYYFLSSESLMQLKLGHILWIQGIDLICNFQYVLCNKNILHFIRN